jgi:hypothetical protein
MKPPAVLCRFVLPFILVFCLWFHPFIHPSTYPSTMSCKTPLTKVAKKKRVGVFCLGDIHVMPFQQPTALQNSKDGLPGLGCSVVRFPLV